MREHKVNDIVQHSALPCRLFSRVVGWLGRMQQGLWHRISEPQSQGHAQDKLRRQEVPSFEAEPCVQHQAMPCQLRRLFLGRLRSVFEDMWSWFQDPQTYHPSQSRPWWRCMPGT